jgi:peroxiredoxin
MMKRWLAVLLVSMAAACGAPQTSPTTENAPTPAPKVIGSQFASPQCKADREALAGKDADMRREANNAMIGAPIPAFKVARVGGGEITDADLKGKWSVLYFWGSWCPDCQADAAYTRALASAIAQDPSLQFITIHRRAADQKWGSVEAYLAEQGVNYPVGLDSDERVWDAFCGKWIPAYLLISPEGQIRAIRTELRLDASPEGGVKSFMKEIAEERRG